MRARPGRPRLPPRRRHRYEGSPSLSTQLHALEGAIQTFSQSLSHPAEFRELAEFKQAVQLLRNPDVSAPDGHAIRRRRELGPQLRRPCRAGGARLTAARRHRTWWRTSTSSHPSRCTSRCTCSWSPIRARRPEHLPPARASGGPRTRSSPSSSANTSWSVSVSAMRLSSARPSPACPMPRCPRCAASCRASVCPMPTACSMPCRAASSAPASTACS